MRKIEDLKGNVMSSVVKLLGVKIGENFTIPEVNNDSMIFHFQKYNGLVDSSGFMQGQIFIDLLTGNKTIAKEK